MGFDPDVAEITDLRFLASWPVYQDVRDGADGKGGQNVQNGVLFQKHRGQGDQDRNDRECNPPFGGAEMPAVPGAQGHCHRTDYMDRWADIGVGIELIKAL